MHRLHKMSLHLLCIRAAPVHGSESGGPALQIMKAGDHAFMVGDVVLPEQQQQRMRRDMGSLLDAFRQSLRNSLAVFSFSHPGRGTSLYDYLALDSTQKHTMEYFKARKKALRVADEYAPRISKFFDDEVGRIFRETDQAIHNSANQHIKDLAEKRVYGYAIGPKYIALQTAVKEICTALMQGPNLSQGPILQSLSKMPVNGRGIQASVEAMQNIHMVDEYQVVCAVAKQLADFTEGFTQLASWDRIREGLDRRIREAESVKIPLQSSSGGRADL